MSYKYIHITMYSRLRKDTCRRLEKKYATYRSCINLPHIWNTYQTVCATHARMQCTASILKFVYSFFPLFPNCSRHSYNVTSSSLKRRINSIKEKRTWPSTGLDTSVVSFSLWNFNDHLDIRQHPNVQMFHFDVHSEIYRMFRNCVRNLNLFIELAET